MKIISGSKKSHVIRAPKNLSIVRPTSGLVKESLFNILSNYFIFNEIKVLDLYAGIGNISYEFGSRGCNEIDSVDINFRCTDFIKMNDDKYSGKKKTNILATDFIKKMAKELDLRIKIFTLSVDKFIMKNESKYDIIFADPPYPFVDKKYSDLINSIFDLNMLNKGGLLVIEHYKKIELNKHKMFYFDKTYGGTTLSFFKKASL